MKHRKLQTRSAKDGGSDDDGSGDEADARFEEDSYKGEFVAAFFLAFSFFAGCLALVFLYRHEDEIVVELESLPTLLGHKISLGMGVIGFVALLGYRFWTT